LQDIKLCFLNRNKNGVASGATCIMFLLQDI
jgi:hypothetical protein